MELPRIEDLFDLSDFSHRDLFSDCVLPWEALQRLKSYCAAHARSEIKGIVAPTAHIEGMVIIGEGTVVESGAFVRGPAIIGKDCEIRANAYIRGDVILGDRCVVGNASELKTTLMFDHAKAPHYNYCGDSILGRNVNLGAGTKLSNFRFDGKEISIRSGGTVLPTGLRKFGAILGDEVQSGCNAVLNPGTIAGKGAMIFPGVVTGGLLKAGARVAR